MKSRYRQKIARFLMIILMGAAVVLSGCGSERTFADGAEGYAADGVYTLPISENEWKVERDDDGDLLFMNVENKILAFSASKWEDAVLSEEEDYRDYYERYLAGIKEDHPEAEAVSFDTPEAGGVPSLYMGVRFQLDGETYRVCVYLIPVPDGTLSFTMTVPEDGGEASDGADHMEKEFRSIVEGIHFNVYPRAPRNSGPSGWRTSSVNV